MSSSISSSSSQSTSKAGFCPHGLPHAACPICSGGGMSGRGKTRDTAPTKPIKNEWSWMKCYTVGLAMKANKAMIQDAKTMFERQMEFAKQLNKNIQNLADRIKNSIENIKNMLPKAAANIVQAFSNIIIMPILNLISQIPKIIEKFAQFQQNINNFIQQAGEKLAAILADIKKFVDKTITDNVKKVAKKFFLFFMSNIEDENYTNDDTLAIFKARELKKFLVKILPSLKKRNKDADRSIESK